VDVEVGYLDGSGIELVTESGILKIFVPVDHDPFQGSGEYILVD